MNRKRKIVLAVMCALSMVMHTLPVSAAEVTVAQCDHDYISLSSTPLDRYHPKDDYYHWHAYEATYQCLICKYIDVRIETRAESHNWKQSYDDLGCNGGVHRYRLTCSNCPGTAEISIICDGKISGKHITPW